MKAGKIKTIQTLCGALFHSLSGYSEAFFHGRDWEVFCSHMDIPSDTVHGVEISGYGFILYTRQFTLRYYHDSFSTEGRLIQITYGKKKRWISEG